MNAAPPAFAPACRRPEDAFVSRRRSAQPGPGTVVPPAGWSSDMTCPWVMVRSVAYHPFLYARMIDRADPSAQPGDLVTVFDKHGQVFGHALYNPRSQIALRMLRYGPDPIDAGFWRERLGQAFALRRQMLRLDDFTDAYRLAHAEGDGLSGLVIERYADHVVFELFSLGMYRRAEELAALVTELLGPPPASPGRPGWKVVIRADDRAQQLEGFRHAPRPAEGPPRVVVRENGVRFRVDVVAGHKTGFFCDQRDNRAALARLARDACVLDLCCYSGGFGLMCRCIGGAREVTSVDLDETALALARDNADLNQVRIEHVHADAFVYLRQMIARGRRYELVVLDPPKLIPTREAVREGRQRYLDLNKLALQVVRPGGVLLTCSCSGLMQRDDFLDMLRQAARISGRTITLFNFTGAAPDHPVAPDCPETSYLKAAWLRVM